MRESLEIVILVSRNIFLFEIRFLAHPLHLRDAL